jgi:hypothetical protein
VLRYSGAASRTSGNQGASSSFSLTASNPSGITTDGTTIWVVDSATDRVYRYDTAGSPQGDWALTTGNSSPTGLTIDPSGASNNVWVVDNGADAVYEYDRVTGAFAGSFALAAGNTNPQGIADPPPVPLPVEIDTAITTQLVDEHFAAAAWKALRTATTEEANIQPIMYEKLSLQLSTNVYPSTSHRKLLRSEVESNELPSRVADATNRAFTDLTADDLRHGGALTDELLDLLV